MKAEPRTALEGGGVDAESNATSIVNSVPACATTSRVTTVAPTLGERMYRKLLDPAGGNRLIPAPREET